MYKELERPFQHALPKGVILRKCSCGSKLMDRLWGKNNRPHVRYRKRYKGPRPLWYCTTCRDMKV